MREATLPSRGVAVATDAQRSAWTTAVPVELPFSLFVPSGTPPQNRAVLSAAAEPPRWTPRGTLAARVETRDSVGFRVVLGDRTLARGATGRGEPIVLRAGPPERGWLAGRVELEPDDFPADDARYFALWIGPPPAVVADASAGQFAATALSTLVADGRATTGAGAGTGIRIASADVVASLPALIVPPPDVVRLGAANRELERLGIPWRFGALDRSPAIAHGGRLDAVAVSERYRLVRAGVAPSDTLVTAGGDPWVVAGPGYVLVGSRLDPGATQLPVRAPFVPWLADMLALRLAAPSGDVGTPIDALPGGPVHLPAGSESLESSGGSRRTVTAELMDAPEERGVWFVLRGGRRVGAVVVNAPADESALERTSPASLAARLGGVRASVATSAGGWVGRRLCRRSHPSRRDSAPHTRPAPARRRRLGGPSLPPERRLVSLPSLLDAIERLPAFTRLLNTLPAPRAELLAAGLPGSTDATLVAALARRLPTRFLVVVADGVPLAERLLADLHTLLDETPVALYPPREGFGEMEPHVEVAGERVETLERLSRGEIRVLLTTPRALLERTRLPGALAELRIELRKGDVRRPRELAEHLELIGFERVPMVEDVAQFSLRGGILDVYSFGMTDPVRTGVLG